MTLPLEREAIMPRIDGIRKNLSKLQELGTLPFVQFSKGDPFDLAQHHLRLALEGVFHIGAHILSRLPGGRTVEYREIAEKLGLSGVVDQNFATNSLVPMAKLRNLLVHHYADLDAQRLYDVINNHLTDIETFLRAVKTVVEEPEKFKLAVK
ncbi:MAG: hypothetical protein UW39_C0009G0020 [Parcubacteria group bacterium GW2011_GWC2_44_17]|uniref:DUF86 domain-containing protein n=1 Tax=Candidatus Jacksonbacteria bacterium RIFCSPLOWO2_02_FULL_44_20 TaxID=1798460 RepID=A0A1G2AAG1_9BACT|nr:MAG: hypothetical protein UW39_C0009G0020 [Parcubacteria group bacterium GW2011_GWC2_44_17]KKT49048.1 MAG: hypothetical protein UW40_C0027G0018 [Parcubacteria group bacterium GW2011_GWF2_44_17]OGY69760.1 MAG: hypothetical protein A3C00_04595 [Candidatus Jacksonbacteria bacterium RIFCSPHIGHO2_02_FULL_44_25]OGY73639.1 MAG: hypothetical protein A3H61_00410 [Candidatus Jacksonbacteria bacterium RIFCSPLOWO2_02_FULL_44_20]OGY74987.1 MAG: hypothetical protein A3H07_05335 [Candidatus Jacksonbacteria